MKAIEVNEERLDALLENSNINCRDMFRKLNGIPCDDVILNILGRRKCMYCALVNKQSLKEWLKKEG